MQAELLNKPEEKKRLGPKPPSAAQDHPSSDLPLFVQRKEQSQAPTQVPAQTVGPGAQHDLNRTPFLWGQDTSVRPFITYVSITVPDATLEEVATYLYDSADAAAPLSSANGGITGKLTQGQTLHLSGAPLSSRASQEFNAAMFQGTILRSQGMPSQSAGTQVYRFTAAGHSYELTEGQYVAMLRGSISWIRLHAGFAKDKAEALLETQRDFVSDTSSLVRGISNYLGDAEMPDESLYLGIMMQADALIAYLNSLDVTPETRTALPTALDQLQSVSTRASEAEHAWHRYINATSEGASSAVRGLEITRNTAFIVAGGLAVAAAAPVVLAAAPELVAVGEVGEAGEMFLVGGEELGTVAEESELLNFAGEEEAAVEEATEAEEAAEAEESAETQAEESPEIEEDIDVWPLILLLLETTRPRRRCRFPTGLSADDAIPISWFKLRHDYFYPREIHLNGGVILDRDDPGATLPDGTPVGVRDENWPWCNKVFQMVPTPRGDAARRFRSALQYFGYNWNAERTQPDHVQDLNWEGADEFGNLWPFEESANLSAGSSQNLQQRITFCPSSTSVLPVIQQRIVDVRSLLWGRFFIIKRFRFSSDDPGINCP